MVVHGPRFTDLSMNVVNNVWLSHCYLWSYVGQNDVDKYSLVSISISNIILRHTDSGSVVTQYVWSSNNYTIIIGVNSISTLL